MIGTGSIVLSYNTGWSCSNECVSGMEFDVQPNLKGEKIAKATTVIEIKGLYDVVEPIKTPQVVSGIVVLDEGNSFAFKGLLQSRTRLVIEITNNEFQTIIKEIKKWQFIKENY